MEWEKESNEKSVQTNLFEGLEGDEKTIVTTIKEFEKISLDVLSVRLKKPVHLLSSLLLGLELKGIVMSRSEEHTSELQSRPHLVCRLLLEKKKKKITKHIN